MDVEENQRTGNISRVYHRMRRKARWAFLGSGLRKSGDQGSWEGAIGERAIRGWHSKGARGTGRWTGPASSNLVNAVVTSLLFTLEAGGTLRRCCWEVRPLQLRLRSREEQKRLSLPFRVHPRAGNKRNACFILKQTPCNILCIVHLWGCLPPLIVNQNENQAYFAFSKQWLMARQAQHIFHSALGFAPSSLTVAWPQPLGMTVPSTSYLIIHLHSPLCSHLLFNRFNYYFPYFMAQLIFPAASGFTAVQAQGVTALLTCSPGF